MKLLMSIGIGIERFNKENVLPKSIEPTFFLLKIVFLLAQLDLKEIGKAI